MYSNQALLIADLQSGMAKLEQMTRSPQAIRFKSAPFGVSATNPVGLSITNKNLGFLPALAIIATGLQAGVSAYGIYAQTELEEERLEMERDLQDRQMKLTEELHAVQLKIMNLQAENLEETQEIAIEVAKARAELEKAKIEFELERVKREQELFELRSSVEYERLTIEQEALLKQKESLIEAEYQVMLKEKAAEVKVREVELEQKIAIAEGSVISKKTVILWAAGIASGLGLVAYKMIRR